MVVTLYDSWVTTALRLLNETTSCDRKVLLNEDNRGNDLEVRSNYGNQTLTEHFTDRKMLPILRLSNCEGVLNWHCHYITVAYSYLTVTVHYTEIISKGTVELRLVNCDNIEITMARLLYNLIFTYFLKHVYLQWRTCRYKTVILQHQCSNWVAIISSVVIISFSVPYFPLVCDIIFALCRQYIFCVDMQVLLKYLIHCTLMFIQDI